MNTAKDEDKSTNLSAVQELSPLLLVGGGGHCRSVIDILECAGHSIAGIVHGSACELRPLLGYPSLGRDSELFLLRQRFSRALVTVGQIHTSTIRQKIYLQLSSLGFILPTIISPSACVSPRAQIGKGSVVLHQAFINTKVSIGVNCILNTRSLIEHDCCIADHCHISVGAILCGSVTVGEGAFVGAGTIVREGVTIGAHAVVGCGLRVLRDVPENTVYTENVYCHTGCERA